jgi:hypothetical protein
MEHATTHSELHSPVIQTVPTVARGLRIGQILNCRQFVIHFVVINWNGKCARLAARSCFLQVARF